MLHHLSDAAFAEALRRLLLHEQAVVHMAEADSAIDPTQPLIAATRPLGDTSWNLSHVCTAPGTYGVVLRQLTGKPRLGLAAAVMAELICDDQLAYSDVTVVSDTDIQAYFCTSQR